MKKLLRPKDILLLSLANLLDAAEEIRDPFKLMSFSYKNMYGWIPRKYRRHNFHQLVSRSMKAQLIEKVEKDGVVYMRITSGGKKTIQRDFPMLSFQNKMWDGKWRIVMFDIEEINKTIRNRLRSKLKELGFGMLQKSVFISPHNIMKDFLEFAESTGIKDYLYLLETENLIVGDKNRFANKIWKLEELNNSYKDLVDEIGKIKNKYMISDNDRTKKLYTQNGSGIRKDVARKNMGVKNVARQDMARKDVAKIRNMWLSIVIGDPFLPKTLMPKPWWGDQAERLVKSLAA